MLESLATGPLIRDGLAQLRRQLEEDLATEASPLSSLDDRRLRTTIVEWLDAPVKRVAAHDVPLPYAPALEDFVLPQTPDIVRAARWLAAY